MERLSSLEQIAALYATHGALEYGENVTQLEHALQCAALAQESGAGDSLIVAALLHDIGHLFVSEETAILQDDRHQLAGARALSGLFGPAVCAPIALHVAAKRYLCCREPAYFDMLSEASKASLQLQGGVFDAVQAEAFEQQPGWQDAVALRRFDDTGKRDVPSNRAFEDYLAVMRAVATPPPAKI